ncbi:hypothetical protein LTR10_020277 [Elasticomyces elasticus]|uniref:Transcription factor domain-containing protein n=1 Tax=Exophiala sideris TaxID=1016849 RepID=A0ABR0IV18_9EURO|nr:hypothetical protein LTR10_020277 [Elasticomyces elasticus]KAK5021297.1 hypothetical protein LTS07_011136 [Exophiala sideris]KAK5024232.1 hypothetical protein LTR13_010941 [Exophiala sideris]KAK5049174.1 hypothetical protein LTR69_011138 [Exophiala sideris]KAK5176485.1 hypothetical protein LTR44_010963 [Eurotiomycetes sp. CCFEE 6388]
MASPGMAVNIDDPGLWLTHPSSQQISQLNYDGYVAPESFNLPVSDSPAPPTLTNFGQGDWVWQPVPDERSLFQDFSTQDDRRADYCLRVLRGYPETFVRQGRSDFLHPRLYRDSSPKPIQDAFCICSVYLTKNEANENMVYRIIDSKVNALLENHSSWTYGVNLAAVQALIFVQIIRLFDGNIRQRVLAEQLEVVLDLWTEQLRSRNVEEVPPMWSAHHVWAFVESARRTILISYLLRGLYSLLKTGVCHLASSMRTLPLSPRKTLWDSQPTDDWTFVSPQVAMDSTVTWEQFTASWQKGQVSNIGQFESLLLVVCRGLDILEEFDSFRFNQSEVPSCSLWTT